MASYTFLGNPPPNVQEWIEKTYLTIYKVQTTTTYKKTGIYSAERDDTSKPVVINWGDGTVETIDSDVSQKPHTYDSVGEFTVKVSNIKTFAASTNNSLWHNTTSQNKYTLKEIVSLNKAVASIGDCAFQNCSGLTSVTIPDSVTSIGRYAFCDCTSLTSVTIPDSVTSIGSQVFYSCSGLTSVTIGNSVKSIESNAFGICRNLTSVTIGNGVTSIGDYAFKHCSGLTNVLIPGSVTSFGNNVFEGCGNLTSVTIGNGVTSIWDCAFQNCSGLTSVTIPDSVTSIGRYAFCDCTSLTSVTIPDSVTSIGNCAFYGCSSLAYSTINGKAELRDQVFFNCPNLHEIWMPAYTVDEVVSHTALNEYGYSDWWIGFTNEKLVMVIIYCMDGTVVVNANDDSSGESSGS